MNQAAQTINVLSPSVETLIDSMTGEEIADVVKRLGGHQLSNSLTALRFRLIREIKEAHGQLAADLLMDVIYLPVYAREETRIFVDPMNRGIFDTLRDQLALVRGEELPKGVQTYWPECGDSEPVNCPLSARLRHDGQKYYIRTNEKLEGRGIKFVDQHEFERRYEVTHKAFEILQAKHRIAMRMHLS